MITVHHRKTYTLKLDIPSNDKLYPTIRDAYDKAKSEPFLHTDEIFAFIEEKVRPLVPYKRFRAYGFRLHSGESKQSIGMTVTFTFSGNELDFIH